jgi:hypothetical protein
MKFRTTGTPAPYFHSEVRGKVENPEDFYRWLIEW